MITKLGGLLLGLIILLGLYMTMLMLTMNAFGEDYKFNMTREFLAEERVVQICIETTIYLEYCDTRYGGIDTHYGEPLR